MADVGIYFPNTGIVCFNVSDLFKILWVKIVVLESARLSLFVVMSETVYIKVDVQVNGATFSFGV